MISVKSFKQKNSKSNLYKNENRERCIISLLKLSLHLLLFGLSKPYKCAYFLLLMKLLYLVKTMFPLQQNYKKKHLTDKLRSMSSILNISSTLLQQFIYCGNQSQLQNEDKKRLFIHTQLKLNIRTATVQDIMGSQKVSLTIRHFVLSRYQ